MLNASYVYLFTMILAMANGSIITKYIYNYNFNNPLLITTISTGFLIPFIFLSKTKFSLSGLFNKIYVGVVLCDTIRTSLSFIILGMLPASIYTILRMVLEMFGAALWKKYIHKKQINNTKLISLIVMSIGSAVFVTPYLVTSKLDITKNMLGVGLTIIRSSTQILGSECEIMAMHDLKWDPSYLVGVQALGSFSIEIVVGLIIVNFTSFESWGLEIWDTKDSTKIIILIVSFIFIYSIHNLTSQTVQKRFNQLVRNVGKTSVPILVWFEMLAIGGESWKYPNSLIMLGGVVIYTSGVLLYIKSSKKKLLILVLGSSGVGKDTLITKLIKKHPDTFVQPQTYTTRKGRPVEHREIKYVTNEEFENLIDNNKFLSYLKEPYGSYGVTKEDIITDKIIVSQDYGEEGMKKEFDIKRVYITPVVDISDADNCKKEIIKRLLYRKDLENVDLTSEELDIRVKCGIADLTIAKTRKDLIFCHNNFNDLDESYDRFEKIVLNFIKKK